MKNTKLLIRIAIAFVAFLIVMYLLSNSRYNSKKVENTAKAPETPTAIISFEEVQE